jgi:hypothetical protein
VAVPLALRCALGLRWRLGLAGRLQNNFNRSNVFENKSFPFSFLIFNAST